MTVHQLNNVVEGGNVKGEEDESELDFPWPLFVSGIILLVGAFWMYTIIFSLNSELASISSQSSGFKDTEKLKLSIRTLAMVSVPITVFPATMIIISVMRNSKALISIILICIASITFSVFTIGGMQTNNHETFNSWAEQRYGIVLDSSPVLNNISETLDSTVVTYEGKTKIATLHEVDGKWLLYDNFNKHELPVVKNAK